MAGGQVTRGRRNCDTKKLNACPYSVFACAINAQLASLSNGKDIDRDG